MTHVTVTAASGTSDDAAALTPRTFTDTVCCDGVGPDLRSPRTGVTYDDGAPAVPVDASGATLRRRYRVPASTLVASAPPLIIL